MIENLKYVEASIYSCDFIYLFVQMNSCFLVAKMNELYKLHINDFVHVMTQKKKKILYTT